MSQSLPKSGFTWYNNDLAVDTVKTLLASLGDYSKLGAALEVDLIYPESLHNDHNDLPYLAEKITPPGSKFPKLTANLNNKFNYVVHHTTLKQALDAGVQLVKVKLLILYIC